MVYVLLWNSGVENLFLASAGRVIHSAEVGWILWIMFFPLLGFWVTVLQKLVCFNWFSVGTLVVGSRETKE